MIYSLLNKKFNGLPDCIQSVARLSANIVMFKKRGNDSQSSRAMIVASLVMGVLTGILLDLQ
jgi:hypothetical protein